MAHTLSQCQLLSSLISLSSSPLSSSSSSPTTSAKSNWFSPLLSLPIPTLRSSSPSTRLICCAASQMEQQRDERPRFKDFPYTSAPIRDLMLESLSTVETRLESQLLPCTLPQDVQYYRDQSGTNHGSIFALSGNPNSPIDIVFGSWLHCKVPTGSLNITTLLCYMKDSTDSPPFLLELIQGSPTTLVIVVDLPPRRDLVMHPDYLKTFYEDTELEKHRQVFFDAIPEATPYVSPSLYIRSASSPTAILARVDTSGEGEGGERKLEEIVRGQVGGVVEKVLETWLDVVCRKTGENVEGLGEEDRVYLRKRDAMFKSQSIEIDLGSSLPRLFGQDVADRVIGALKGFMS